MGEPPHPASVTLATFNIHMGVDGWGRPFDLVGACRSLGADVLILQESWVPDDGRAGSSRRIAAELGYTVVAEAGMAHIRLLRPRVTTSTRWGPPVSPLRRTFDVDGVDGVDGEDGNDGVDREDGVRAGGGGAGGRGVPGRWALALLSRVPVTDVRVLPLGKLRRDRAHRFIVGCTVGVAGGTIEVFGTHMSHITHGSHAQFRRLGGLLPPTGRAAVLAGDMNLWGPPVRAYLPGWRRAVTARTWPAPRPHSQLDHVLVTPPVAVLAGRIGPAAGSDHRPVVVTLGLR